MGSKARLTFNLAWALRLVWDSGKWLSLATITLVFANGALPLAGLYLVKLVIDAVNSGLAATDKTAAFAHVGVLIGFLGAVYLLEFLLSSITALVNTAQAQIVTEKMHNILHAKSVEMDLEYYENSEYYDTLHRAQQQASFRPTQIVNSLLHLVQSGVSIVAITVLLISFHWSVPLGLIVAILPGLLVRFRSANTMFAWQRGRTATERQASYFNWMLSRDDHAKEIRIFDLGGIFTERYRSLRSLILKERLRLSFNRSLAELTTQCGPIVALFGLYGLLAHRALHGLMTVGDLVMFFQAAQRGYSYVNQFLASVAGLYENNLFLSNLQEFLRLKPKIVEPPHPVLIPTPIQSGINLNNVTFRYPNSDKIILDGINMTIHAGEHVALVGHNGAGKTTLIKLLCRLYDPTAGSITIDDIDLRNTAVKDLRKHIGMVFQDYGRYHQTARDNIWFGNVELARDDLRIERAAKLAGADEVIGRLKDGYDTMLGKWFENGEELSIGEWQKLALARAFLRDAQILVLDEPTSFMDAKAEYEMFERFHRLMKGKTAILISHRLSTVRMVDKIYVLDGGGIIESGTHDELVVHGGKYADLFETQAQYYR